MPLMEMPASANDPKFLFLLRSAKAWQNYHQFDTRGLLPGIMLSDEQLAVVQQNEEQMLINGSAGSGKSITLLYKMIRIMEQEAELQRILYLTFNRTLLEDARKRAELSPVFENLKGRHDLHMNTFHYMAFTILKQMGFEDVACFNASLQSIKNQESTLQRRIANILEIYTASEEYRRLPQQERFFETQNAVFFLEEILWMKANGFVNKKGYLEVERTGRSNNPRLTKAQRNTVFNIFERYQQDMRDKFHHYLDMEDYALLILQYLDQVPYEMYYDYVFVDEVQDLQPMQIKVLIQLTKKSIVLSGDPKQRIYKRSPHSYANLGLHIQGRRNRALTKNFRSTKQIIDLANSLKFEDVANEREDGRNFTREGEKPEVRYYPTADAMHGYLVKTIKKIIQQKPDSTIAVIHREEEEIQRGITPNIKTFLEQHFYLITAEQYGRRFDYTADKKPVFFTDAFSIKGLEFDYVFILHFDRKHYPHRKRIDDLNKKTEKRDTESYDKDYDSILNDEKKILYVAITRARNKVVLLWFASKEMRVSPFIREFNPKEYTAIGFDNGVFHQ